MQKKLCRDCVNYLGNGKCLAFDKIPDEILSGDNDHLEPLEGQENGFIFMDSVDDLEDFLADD